MHRRSHERHALRRQRAGRAQRAPGGRRQRQRRRERDGGADRGWERHAVELQRPDLVEREGSVNGWNGLLLSHR